MIKKELTKTQFNAMRFEIGENGMNYNYFPDFSENEKSYWFHKDGGKTLIETMIMPTIFKYELQTY